MALFKDIVNQIKTQLPKYTDLFNDSMSITGYSIAGNIATITSPNHGFNNGDILTIRGTVLQNNIINYNLNANGTITFYTAIKHDMTTNWTKQVEIGGYSNYNGLYDIISLSNDHSYFTIDGTDAPIGTGYILENRIDGLNGTYAISNVTTNTFDINVEYLLNSIYIIDNTSINYNVRVAGVPNTDRIEQMYNNNPNIDKWWGFVMMNDDSLSYGKQSETQAVQKITNANDFNGELVTKFSLYVVARTDEELGAETVDKMFEVRPYIIKSLAGSSFDMGFADNKGYLAMYTGSTPAGYVGAYYIHRFDFELTNVLGNLDLVEDTETRAFTLIDKTTKINTGVGFKNDIIYLRD